MELEYLLITNCVFG